MIIKEALKQHHKIEIELLLAHVLKKPKEFVFLHPEYRMSENQKIRLQKLVFRRQKGEPIAYILGYRDFYGLRFKVNQNVLIPRPETEMVVDLVKSGKWKVESGKSLKILDMGTGGGCIIVSLAKFLQARGHLVLHKVSPCEFCASDISSAALSVAKQNAKMHHVVVKFIKSDLLENIKFEPDILIANLPYGWKAWKNNTSAETRGLKFEPQSALFTKERGLYLYHKLLKQIAAREHGPLSIYFEIDPRQKKQLALLVKKYLPKSKLIFHKDPGCRWRYAQIFR